MTRLHSGRVEDGEVRAVRTELAAFGAELAGERAADAPLAFDAFQEAVEAILLDAVVRGQALPGPSELRVGSEAYLLGLGDLVGEVRRLALRALGEGHLPQAEGHLARMEGLYEDLMRFEAPRGVVALKPKQDTARALLERTRSEVTMARMLARANLPSGPRGGEA